MKRILKSVVCAIALLFGTFAVMAQGITVQNGQSIQVERWIKTQFGKGKTPPFSFMYGGRPSSEVLRQCQYSLTRLTSTEENQIHYLATYTDNKTGLKVECEINGWTDYGAVEWVLRFENTGSKNTPAISQVQTADITFVHQTNVPTVYYAEGSTAERSDFAPHERTIQAGDTMVMEPVGGRSSDGAFPFFNLHTAQNEGVMVAIGWSGTWQSQIISTDNQRLRLKAGLKHLDAGLLPGERIRTASVCLLFWQILPTLAKLVAVRSGTRSA